MISTLIKILSKQSTSFNFILPVEISNLARKKKLHIVEVSTVYFFNVKHEKLISDENDIIYLVDGKIHHEGDEAACLLNTRNSQCHHLWLKNNIIHRDDDLPAYICSDTQIWFKNGKRHRDNDLPAEISSSYEIWYKNDKIHRSNGLPAWIKNNRPFSNSYWINGKKLSKEALINYKNIKNF